MEFKVKNYLFLILLHASIGALVFSFPIAAKIYGILIFLVSLYFIIKTRNKNNEVLYAAAYIVGSEVFLRMTGGNPNHEFAKYSVIVFLIIGMLFSGFSKNALPYWIFLILLIPGIIIGTQTLSLQADNIRKTILFNVSGPLCLGIASLYCYNRKITLEEVNNILLLMGLPIISCMVYLTIYTPELKEVLIKGNSSNTDTSGGYGPNQVATLLGLGMFVFFTRILFASRHKIFFLINLILFLGMSYRGLLTFSRGGIITSITMIIILLIILYLNSKSYGKLKMIYLIGFLVAVMVFTWFYTENQTGGFIGKRYSNEDALGRKKDDNFTGRGKLAAGEMDMFFENPFFGVGAGKGTEIRSSELGVLTASHDEITRMLAEHGALGILALMILFFTPIFLYIDNKQNIYIFCFLLFWLLTINHAAMRTASPSFVYALALLKVRFKDNE